MSTIAFDQFALTRIADFARSLSRLHQASRRQPIDDDAIDREFNAVCLSVWGYTTDDFSDDLFSDADHAWLDSLDEAHARIFAAEQGYDLVDDNGMLTDWWGYCWMILAENRGLRRRSGGQRDVAAHLRQRHFIRDHFHGYRRYLHLAEPRADIGGQARIGCDRGEFSVLAAAGPDTRIRHQPVGGR